MKKFLILLLFALSLQLQAKVYLVAVGISDYPGTVNDLSLCDGDARDLAALYKKNNQAETILLCNSKATTAAVTQAMKNLFRKAQANDIVVLFYSGHGEKKGLCLYDKTLTFKEIMKIFDSLKCKNKMIFSDSCFSGSLRSKATLQASDVQLTNNVMFFLGSRSNEYSIENGSEFTNSYFTHALIRALSGKADTNRNRIISAKELFTYVSKHVKEYSDDQQHPVMWGHFSDDMPVMKW
ncbi:MAG: caspase family protein [Bacteroidales bacterium]|nr:caspase family protein [Bacteroidales bacterium]